LFVLFVILSERSESKDLRLFVLFVILSERSESKDPDDLRPTTAVRTFLPFKFSRSVCPGLDFETWDFNQASFVSVKIFTAPLDESRHTRAAPVPPSGACSAA